jgi:hypothetical protein
MNQILIGKIGVEKGMMDAAKINEIQASARHDKESFRVALGTLRKIFCQICNVTDTAVQVKLTNSNQLFIDTGFICHTSLTEGNAAFQTDRFLVLFGLYW